jgi:hypothetical protein
MFYFQDPLSHVVLCLQLIRKFSHFPQNLPIIIKCKAATAVMGCMAVYLKEEDVQLNCLDILAKITTFQYQLTEKVNNFLSTEFFLQDPYV